MKISHISSSRQLADTISNFQASNICEVKSLFYNQSINLSEQIHADTDILHIHGISLLESPELLNLIQNRLSNKQVVIISIFSDEYRDTVKVENTLLKNQEIIDGSSAVFLQDTLFLSSLDSLENWTWSPAPVISNIDNPQEFEFEAKDNLNLLFIEDPGSDPYKALIHDTIKKLAEEGMSFDMKSIKRSVTDEAQIEEAINSCDILIENPVAPAISHACLKALACGKTVLAGIPDNSSNLTKQFEYSPILKTDAGNLYYRLKSLSKQPKSLRDFGRRGLKYIQDYHNPKEICQGYLEIYKQFV